VSNPALAFDEISKYCRERAPISLGMGLNFETLKQSGGGKVKR